MLCSATAFAQPAPGAHLRGSIDRIDAAAIVIKERNGETIALALADNLAVNEALPIDPASIQSGKFVGTAAMPGADGSLAALAVRHRRGPVAVGPPAGASMTNVAVAPAAQCRTMTLRYQDGEKAIFVRGIPVVTLRPTARCGCRART